MTKSLFKKGEEVKVVNPNNHFYDETAMVLMYDELTNKYLVEFPNGYKTELYTYDLVKKLSLEKERELQIAQLHQLIDLALLWKDKDMFDKYIKRIKKIEEKVNEA